jgi:hypothetical protein
MKGEDEANFVTHAWVNDDMLHAPESGPLPKAIANEAYRKAVKQWLGGERGIGVLIAESKSVPGEFLGFVVHYDTPRHGNVLMYVYVVSKYRTTVETTGEPTLVKRGIGSALLEAAGFVADEPFTMAFRTMDWSRFMRTSARWRSGVWSSKPAKYGKTNFVIGDRKRC